jgi:hypothetical protein
MITYNTIKQLYGYAIKNMDDNLPFQGVFVFFQKVNTR